MIKLSDLFHIEYGNGFSLNALEENQNGINFVSRTEKNNGVSGVVSVLKNKKSFKSGLITVSLSGSPLEAFIQTKDFYTGFHVYVLTPKIHLTEREKIFYCMIIKSNKYRYSYGRQANTTLKDLLIPSKEEIPGWVYTAKISDYSDIRDNLNKNELNIIDRKFDYFDIGKLFNLEKGKGPLVSEIEENKNGIHFITASEKNNGVSYIINYNPIHNGNTISVASNGSVGESFYQEKAFCATGDLNILIPKFELNKYIAMFIITIIRKEKYRFSYGRKWGLEKMRTSKIKLPVDTSGNPDRNFMENYIKSLPYSKYL